MISIDVLDFKFFYEKQFDICGPDIAKQFDRFIELNFKNKKYNKGLEYCCGTGAIGFKLLQTKKISNLVLSDINKNLEVSIKHTIETNKWQNTVKFVVSEKLSDIPNNKFDLFVSNPPWKSIMIPGPIDPIDKLKHFDIGWELHRNMYNQLTDYVHEQSDIFIIEDYRYSDSSFWKEFLEGTGLVIQDTFDFSFTTTRKNNQSHKLDSTYIMHLKKNDSKTQ